MMDLKTYNVKAKGLKNLKEGILALNVLRENKLKYSINKLFENNLRIILTNDYYQMRDHNVKNLNGETWEKFTSINMDDFDTSNLTTMSMMFNSCGYLTSLDLSSLDTSKITDMSDMFSGCDELTSLDVSNFNTSNVTNMAAMFEILGLTSLDLSDFDTSNVNNMNWMFAGCSNLTEIKGVIDMKSCTHYLDMFANCNKLSGVKIKNPPEGFTNHDADTGLNKAGLRADQYVIVE